MHVNLTSISAYARTARFASVDTARAAYQAIQDFIYTHEEVELSVFNMLVVQLPHLVILGEQPSPALNERISGMLADGEATHLPPELIRRLAARRTRREGLWSEHHPGLSGEPLS